MTAGIQTIVLIVTFLGSASPIAVPGYGSMAECQKAAAVAKTNVPVQFAFCIPGPVEAR